MIKLYDNEVIIDNNEILDNEKIKNIDKEKARNNTLAWQILSKHSKNTDNDQLHITFDCLASHDITYVGIIQTARASGLQEFPLPYVLTNCHNSLCAVGGTINEDDHVFGLSAAKKYGGIFVPANCAVIHQYMREMMTKCGSMILGSDSHTRYGAFGTMGIGEGGPELVKQLLNRTYDINRPNVIAVYLENAPKNGVGPQDVALALIKETFKNGFVKNSVLEFTGPGISNLSVEYRSGIDVMTTETTCLSSIWPTDEKVKDFMQIHQRSNAYKELKCLGPALYNKAIVIDLAKIEPMIALPFHPSNAYTIKEVIENASDILASIDDEAIKLFGDIGKSLNMKSKYKDKNIMIDQAIIAGCAGGTYENLSIAAYILENKYIGNNHFSLSVYPASEPQALALVKSKATEKLMTAGVNIKSAFCGPCFGAGDTPFHGALSIRHSTRNFPNREGSKPNNGQISAVALMDARSIAATSANQGKLCPATECDFDNFKFEPYYYEKNIYNFRVYNGFNKARKDSELKLGPNITDWPKINALPKNIILKVVSVLQDLVTTTDELIPSGETSSLRSNPLKLAEFTLSRRDPEYVNRAKEFQKLEIARCENKNNEILNELQIILKNLNIDCNLNNTCLGTTIVANKPGDGSAREQAASCQKVLGGLANIAIDYATKRYRSNLINWGMLPFTINENEMKLFEVNDYIYIPNILDKIKNLDSSIHAKIIKSNNKVISITLNLNNLSNDERQIIMDGCLINHYSKKA